MPRQQKHKPGSPQNMGMRDKEEPINSHNLAKEYTNTDLQEMQEGEFQILILHDERPHSKYTGNERRD